MEREIGIPHRFLEASVKNIQYPTIQQEMVKNWALKPFGNLVMTGATGRGKTYTSVALMYFLNKYHKIPWHEQRFVEVCDLYQDWLSNMDGQENNLHRSYILKTRKLVVFDDLGTRKPSDAFLDYLFNIINHRCNDPNLLTIYTTNLNSKELTEFFGPRIVSRICDNKIIVFDAQELKDLRRDESKKINVNFMIA